MRLTEMLKQNIFVLVEKLITSNLLEQLFDQNRYYPNTEASYLLL